MVRIGQSGIEEYRFGNRSRPRLGVEVLSLAELRRRVSTRVLTAPHRLDFHQIILITGGHGVAVVDFETHACRAGTLLHTRPGQVQRLPRADGDGAAPEGTLVLFTRTFVQRPGLLAGLGVDGWQLDGPAQRRIRTAVADLAAEYAEYGAHDDGTELLRHLLSVLLIRIARLPRPPSPGDGPGDTTYARFVDAVERDFAATRSVRHYADRLGYSTRTLTRAAQAATGRTAKDVIDSRVCLEAKRLLAHTDRPVGSIAHALGFSEPTNFVKFFVARTGTTPGAFREAERSG